MLKLQLVKNNVVINSILVDCDMVVSCENAGPGDVYDPDTDTFTKPAQE